MSTKTNSISNVSKIVADFLSKGYAKVTITEDSFQIGWWTIQAS